jgi:hypothetical protein
LFKSVQVIKIEFIFVHNLLLTKLNTMKTEFRKVMDFLELQQQEDKLNTNQLHLIIQTLTTLLADEQLQEVENLFNYFKK